MFVGRQAWILVTDAAQYAATRLAVDQATDVARSWGADIPQRDIERFLRAYMAQLARSGR